MKKINKIYCNPKLLLIYLILIILRTLPFHFFEFFHIWNIELSSLGFKDSPIQVILPILVIISDILNVYLLYILGMYCFDEEVGLFTALIYVLSNWILYLVFGFSIQIFIITLILLTVIGLKKYNTNPFNKLLTYLCPIVLLLLSVRLALFSLLLIIVSNVTRKRTTMFYFLFMVVLGYVFIRFNVVRYGLRQDFPLLYSQGLINNVNEFRGIVLSSNLKLYSKFIDNKYWYLVRNIILNSVTVLNPINYFIQQFRIYNFSFAIPIYTIFLIPFFYSLRILFRKFSFTSILKVLLVTIPFAFADLNINQVAIFTPFIFLIIGFGLSKIKVYKNVFILLIVILVIQIAISFSDMALREPVRYLQNVESINN